MSRTSTRQPPLQLRVMPHALRTRRLLAALEQEELGRKVQVSESAVSRWERGTRNPTPQMIRKLARALKCDPLDIAEVVDA